MKNEISQLVERVRYGHPNLPSLPPVTGHEFGTLRTNGDFNARAADLIVGMEADQFENLLEALVDLCKECHDVSGDSAYASAAVKLAGAKLDVQDRMGN